MEQKIKVLHAARPFVQSYSNDSIDWRTQRRPKTPRRCGSRSICATASGTGTSTRQDRTRLRCRAGSIRTSTTRPSAPRSTGSTLGRGILTTHRRHHRGHWKKVGGSQRHQAIVPDGVFAHEDGESEEDHELDQVGERRRQSIGGHMNKPFPDINP